MPTAIRMYRTIDHPHAPPCALDAHPSEKQELFYVYCKSIPPQQSCFFAAREWGVNGSFLQGCLVLLSFRAGTRNGGVVGFTVRSSRVHAYKNHEPYWAEMEMGQAETKAPDGNHDHHVVAGFIVRHPKAGTNFSLLRLASDSQRFEFLANQFQECWKKGKAPDVARIYEIQVPQRWHYSPSCWGCGSLHERNHFFFAFRIDVVLRAERFVNVLPLWKIEISPPLSMAQTAQSERRTAHRQIRRVSWQAGRRPVLDYAIVIASVKNLGGL